MRHALYCSFLFCIGSINRIDDFSLILFIEIKKCLDNALPGLICFFPPQCLIMFLEDMGNISSWKESLFERTISRQTTSLMQLVYGKSTSGPTASANEEVSSEDDESNEDDFFTPKVQGNKVFSPLCLTNFFFSSIFALAPLAFLYFVLYCISWQACSSQLTHQVLSCTLLKET